MLERAVVIWSNSKLLEYMSLSQLDILKLKHRLFYNYVFCEKPIISEIQEFFLCFRKTMNDRGINFVVNICENQTK